MSDESETYPGKFSSFQAGYDAAKVKYQDEIKNLTIERNAALSREQEANRDWSTEARKWCKERNELKKLLVDCRTLIFDWTPEHHAITIEARINTALGRTTPIRTG